MLQFKKKKRQQNDPQEKQGSASEGRWSMIRKKICPLDGALNLSPILTWEDNMGTHDSAGKALAAKPF